MTSTPTRSALVRPLPASRRRHWTDADRYLESADGVTRDQQGALALSFPMPSGVNADPRSAALTLTHPPVDPPVAPDPQAWAARFLQAVVEVVSSDRPVTQLARWTDARVYAEIARRQKRVVAHRGATALRPNRQQIATVHVCQPTRSSAEVAARVTSSGRSRAIAARLEFIRGRWLCTAIRFG